MKKSLKFTLLFPLLFLNLIQVFAQENDTTIVWQITTLDDNEFVGYILSETESTIEFKTATIGTITIQKRQIKRKERLISDESTNGLLWPENPLAYRYFLRNSAIPLKKGDAYYQNAWIFVNNFDFGITDNFSLGTGLVPIFLFGGPTPIWLTPRVSFPTSGDKLHIGAGGLVGTVLSRDINTFFGFGFGNVTFGNKNKNVTVGMGYGFADGELADRPTFSFAGMWRTGKRGYFMTENYLITTGFETVAILSAGGRYVGKKVTIDYGGFYVPNLNDINITPWLSISVPIGSAN